MLIWTPDTVLFQRDAAQYGSYHKTLAAHLAAYLPPDAHVCDAGCGLGYLACALAPYCKRVTAVDSDTLALAVLREDTPKNVEVCEGDMFTLSPTERYDAMIFCFFAAMDDTLLLAKKHCRGKVIVVKRGWTQHRFSPQDESVRRDACEEAEQYLRTRGIPFLHETLTLDMGQPFRSREDAVRFFAAYGNASVDFSDVEARLVKTGNAVFPYYLPQEKPLGIFIFDAKEIP